MAIEILEFRSIDKGGALVGSLTVKLVKIGMEIRNVTLFSKGGARWINLPQKEYTKKDGTRGYQELVRFTEKTVQEQFKDEVLAALDEYQNADPEPEKLDDGDIPF
jgi:hypothetical protein